MAEASETVVRTRGLTRRFGALTAVDDLDLELRPGECLGLLGPNGAGKSTTVRILSTLLRPSAGEVRVLGLDPVSDGDRRRARIGVVSQELALYDELPGRQNLRFFGSLHGLGGVALGEAVENALGLFLAQRFVSPIVALKRVAEDLRTSGLSPARGSSTNRKGRLPARETGPPGSPGATGVPRRNGSFRYQSTWNRTTMISASSSVAPDSKFDMM